MRASLIAIAILAGCAPAGAAESVSRLDDDTPTGGGSDHTARVESDVAPRYMKASAGISYHPGTRARKRWKRARKRSR